MNNLEQEENALLEAERQYWVDLYENLEKLKKSKPYKEVIEKGYFRDKAMNGVSLLANEYTLREGKRTAIMEGLIAISHLEDYFATITNLGHTPDSSEDEE